jgi:alpha-glucosidase
MLSDYPEAYDHNPGMEFLEKVPTVWDETRALNGEPGKYITLARRNEATWYVGAMTNWDARDLDIPLTFLGSGTYTADIFADGADADRVATSLQISNRDVAAGDTLHMHLASGGGWAAILTPMK